MRVVISTGLSNFLNFYIDVRLVHRSNLVFKIRTEGKLVFWRDFCFENLVIIEFYVFEFSNLLVDSFQKLFGVGVVEEFKRLL